MNNCTIYDKSFLEDLINKKNSINNASINFAFLSNLISNTPHLDDTWTPLFITRENSSIPDTLLLDKGYVAGYDGKNNTLGVQNFLTMANPQFNFWTTSGSMVSDWILNRQNISHFPIYGLLCWFKKLISPQGKKLSLFPNNSRLKLLGTNRSFIKIDNTTLYETNNRNKQSSKFDSDGSIKFEYDNTTNSNYTSLSSIGENALFIESDIIVSENRDGLTTTSTDTSYSDIIIQSNKYLLWIPDGDVYSYYINNDEHNTQNNRLSPRSFCSPSLYTKYNSIYHKLTFELIRTGAYRQTHIARCYKNLAKYLSTSPFTDEYSISRLLSSTVKDYTDTFLQTSGNNISIILYLNQISSYFNSLDTVNNVDHRSITNNIIYNLTSLKEKIVEKYGAKLVLSADGVISSKKPLVYGANVKIDQFSEYYISSGTTNSIIYANQNISVGDLLVQTDYADKKSKIRLRFKQNPFSISSEVTDLYMWDAARPIVKSDPVNELNLVLAKTTNNINLPEYNDSALDNSPDTVIFKYIDSTKASSQIQLKILPDNLILDKYRTAEDSFNPSDILIKNDFICKWERISGPELRFIDESKLSIVSSDDLRYNRDTKEIVDLRGQVVGLETLIGSPQVYVLPSKAGRYQVKCTINSPYGTFVKIKTFYVVSGARPEDLISERLLNEIKAGISTNVYILPMGLYAKNQQEMLNPLGKKFNIEIPQVEPVDTFFNVIGQLLPPGAGINRSTPVVQPENLVYPDPIDVSYVRNRERVPIKLNPKNLRVHAPIINSIAIHGRGLALPIAMNGEVKVDRERPTKLINNTFHYLQDHFGGPIRADRSLDSEYIYDKPSSLSISYSLPNGLKYKIDKIRLERIRHPSDPQCANCLSLYNNNLYGYRKGWGRSLGAPILSWENDAVSITNGVVRGSNILTDADEQFSTDFSPPIKTYGGWDGDTREKIGIEIPGHPNPETIFPPVTGRPLNYLSDKPSLDPPYQSRGYKYCFEDVLQDNTDKYLNFEKGVFHPQSGWIPNNSPLYNDVKNLSSVLKFNPGARESYSFNGPNIESIQNDSYLQHEGHTYIIPNKFSSSITLKLEEGVQPIVRVGPCNERSACRFDDPPEWEWLNQIHREYADQETGVGPGRDHTHGFRVLRGGGVKRHEAYSTNNWFPSMDEFGFNGGLNNFDYGFTVTGPPYPPGPIPQDILDFMEKAAQSPDVACVNDRGEQPPNYYRGLKTPTTLWRGIRRPAVWNFTIRDLEVRLNFLNYVNTKDISIVFESGPCVDEANRIFNGVAPTYQSPIFNFPRFVNQTIESDFDAIAPGKNSAFDWPISPISVFNSGINNYLSDLSKMNTTFDINKNSSPTPPFLARSPFLPQKLCLLNQEYIQNHSYNLSIKFSDSANKYNVLNDHNYNSGNFIPSNYQNIIPTNGEIRPSICPFGYSDKDINIYHNIVLNNKLNIVNNTFSKYSNKSLFNNSIAICPGAGVTKSPTKTSGNTFKCIIYVYDEHDDMLPNDNTINSQLYTNIYDFTKNINTSDLYSSLCSWELLFHVGDTKKPTTPILNSLHSYGNHEALSLIEYGKPPQYGGYSFIANLKEYKHMLPFVNINAPNIFFQDYSLCSAPKSETIGRLKSIPGVEFPWLAILAATYAYSGSIGLGGAGGLVGLSAGIALGEIAMSLAIQQIVNYFSDLRVQEFKEDVNNDIYQQDYLRYPFGSPEKILVNFSKDGIFWYKAEASIFKYRHTPVLEHKKYNYIRLGKDGIPALSRFNFEIITDIRSLLDEKYIKTLSIKCEDKDTLYGPQTIDNTEYNFDDIVDVTFTDDEEELCDNGLYYVPNSESWISLSGNPTILCEKNDYISYNQILFNDNNTTERSIFKNFHTSVANKQLIMLEGSIPYEIFDFNDIVHVSGTGIAADPARVVTLDIDFTTSEGMALYQQNVDPITGELRPIVMKDEEPTYTTKIIGKALVYKNNKPYSVLRVDRLDMDKVNFIMPDNNVVVLFDTSSSTDMSNNPTNMYAFNKEIIKDTDMPEVYNTTNSYGSYGDGSYNTKKNILSYFPKINNIENIYTIFNNYNTDMLLKNNMFFSTTPDNMFTGQAGTAGLERPKYIGSSVAYPHKIQEATKFVSNTNRFIVGDENNVENIENILDNLKSLSFNNIEYNNAQLLYVKNNSFKTSSIVPSPTGYVSIENDYEEKIPIAAVGADGLQLSETEYNNLISKLNLLENNTENTDIESLIGQKTANATNQIINTYNLSYMYRHYESLTEYDANKKLIELALTVFYKERNDILKLLNEISKEQIATIVLEDEEIPIVGTILSENQSFIWIGNPGLEPQKIDKNIIEKITRNFIRDSSNIRPQKFAKVSSIKPFDRSSLNILAYNITYEINNDDYWINLDPHQSCTIAEELRPKVLKKIEYVCRPANFTDTIGGTPILVTNNICNNKRGSTLQNSPPDPDGINYKQGTRSIRGASYEAYIYDIGENIINSNKASIANKATAAGLPIQWKEIQIRRNYHINGNNRNMGFTYNYGETLVTVFETYDVLLTQLEIDGGVARSSKNTQDADVSAMGSAGSIENIPIIGHLTSGAPAIPPRSPSGFGLLDRSGLVRTSQSLKIYNVCNLDDINNLKIKIRKMPRQLRGIDVYSTVYRYGRFNLFRPPPRQGGFNNSTPVFDSLPPTELAGFSENQPVYNNNMYYWKCMEIENNKLIESTTPLFFQLMNEMMYRTFFGSVDRIENRDSVVKTQFLWEMIPYEFLNKIPPSST